MKNTTITILLATYNGAAFLDEQLNTIANQSWNNIDVLASDDGSSDDTLKILEAWKHSWTKGTFRVLKGPQKGFSENFRHLLCSVENDQTYIAFSDQDDIWHLDKLHNAISKLAAFGENTPAMYCSRTRLVDIEGKELGLSPLFSKRPSFENALTQSLAGGNTIVLNAAAFRTVRESVKRTDFVSHDWWCYLFLMGTGGHVYYDPAPQIDYRQHPNNVFGRNTGIKAIWKRIIGIITGDYSKWFGANLQSLERNHIFLTEENYKIIQKLLAARRSGGLPEVVRFV
ncbi:glycosyltransferase family 2 protein [Pseudochrobactrum sp. B5]|uniref:glycosyltransferase family 2 protein n=1 Tax=Pseudochrobactrum sp. B5 TaxID=1289478 RepID=UPI000951B422|nr:glycosyltransferase family 2 protein [Pseudochrobactrum sp. B5]